MNCGSFGSRFFFDPPPARSAIEGEQPSSGDSPGSLVSQDCIEDGDELSHEGDDDDLGSLAGGLEMLLEGCEDGVASGSDERGHVGDIADGLSSACDVPLTLEASAFVVEGSDAE